MTSKILISYFLCKLLEVNCQMNIFVKENLYFGQQKTVAPNNNDQANNETSIRHTL